MESKTFKIGSHMTQEVLKNLGIVDPEKATEQSLLEVYDRMAHEAAYWRMHPNSNDSEISEKAFECEREALRYGAAIATLRGEKLSPRHPFYAALRG